MSCHTSADQHASLLPASMSTAMMYDAVVPVAKTFEVWIGMNVPDGTFVNVTSSPPIVRIRTLPAIPTYKQLLRLLVSRFC